MFFLFLLVSAFAYTDIDYETRFKEFVLKYNKVYEQDTMIHRYNVFRRNMDLVYKHNRGNSSWSLGINKFSDLTNEEFSKIHNGLIPSSRTRPAAKLGKFLGDVDWVAKGAVTPIKDQGQCGSCWAFSTTGGIEGSEFIDSGRVVSLSEQALVDCSSGNDGCQGGLMDTAFEYVESKGLPTETSYPYLAVAGACKSYTPVTRITSYTDVEDLETAIQKQPISIAVDASTWSSYTGGLYTCTAFQQLDHGVLLVGSTPDYWVVKNSWGSGWGENGYIRLKKLTSGDSDYADGNCGLKKQPSYPSGATASSLSQ